MEAKYFTRELCKDEVLKVGRKKLLGIDRNQLLFFHRTYVSCAVSGGLEYFV
jgi:hypothetical protein